MPECKQHFVSCSSSVARFRALQPWLSEGETACTAAEGTARIDQPGGLIEKYLLEGVAEMTHQPGHLIEKFLVEGPSEMVDGEATDPPATTQKQTMLQFAEAPKKPPRSEHRSPQEAQKAERRRQKRRTLKQAEAGLLWNPRVHSLPRQGRLLMEVMRFAVREDQLEEQVRLLTWCGIGDYLRQDQREERVLLFHHGWKISSAGRPPRHHRGK